MCQVALVRARAATTELEVCGRCGGVWLDVESSRRAIEGLVTEAEQLLAARVEREAPGRCEPAAYRSPADRTRRCPDCERPMSRARVSDVGIEVDACALHGTWFDPGELAPVASAFALRRAAVNVEVRRFSEQVAEGLDAGAPHPLGPLGLVSHWLR